MKLHRDTQEETVIIGGEQELTFSIDSQSGVIFDILRDKMYSNKIGSIVREVASNSRDANREAGNADKPITIMITRNYSEALPDQECIVFRDCGPGITESRMADVFVKYAASTKRFTNSQTGGFGLGAKTPFAYTDSFYIHTIAPFTDEFGRKYNRSYFYNALIDSTGVGKMILLESFEDEESKGTGTSIIIPLNNSSDTRKFANETIYYTSLWSSVEYLNIEVNSDYTVEGDESTLAEEATYKVVKSQYSWSSPYQQGVYALVDSIPYPITTNNKILSKISRELSGVTIFLKFNVGEVSVSATRESIEFNEKTEQAIDRVFRRSIDTIIQDFQKELDSLSKLEAIKSVLEIFSKQQKLFNHQLSHHWSSKFIQTLYKDVEEERVDSKIKIQGGSVKKLLKRSTEVLHSLNCKRNGFEIYSVPQGEPAKYTNPKSTSILTHLGSTIVFMDARKDYRRNITLLKESSKDIILIQPTGGSELDREQSSFLSDLVLGYNLDIRLYSEVQKAEIPKATQAEILSETMEVPIRLVNTYSGDGGEKYSIVADRETREVLNLEELTKDSFFVLIDKLSSLENSNALSLWSLQRSLADTGKRVFIVSESVFKRYLEDKVPYTKVYRGGVENLSKLLSEIRYSNLSEGIDPNLLKRALTIQNSMYQKMDRVGLPLQNIYTTDLETCLLLGCIDNKVRVLIKAITGITVSIDDFLFYREHSNTVQSLKKHYPVEGLGRKGVVNIRVKVERLASKYRSILHSENYLYYLVFTNEKIAGFEGDKEDFINYIKQIKNLRDGKENK